MTGSFDGFSKTLRFLSALKKNNDRDWFAENKARYEREWMEPALAFVAAMEKPVAAVSKMMLAVPKKQGGSLMRIYRDTRFAKDKTPYKTNMGIHFRHAHGKDVHAPGLYVHIEPGDCFLGAGIWRPDSKAVKQIRTWIAEEPAKWKRVRGNRGFCEHFDFAGDSLSRPPAGFDRDHPLIDDLKRKDFIGVCQLPIASVKSADFVAEAGKAFRAAKPLMRFLCEALELPF